MRETTHGDRGEINPEDSTRKQPREKTSRTEVGPWWVITVIEKRNLKFSSCSENFCLTFDQNCRGGGRSLVKILSRLPWPFRRKCCPNTSRIHEEQKERLNGYYDKFLVWFIPLTVNKSMILCSDFFSFRWRDEPFCSRFLNWSTCETGLVFSSLRDSSSQKRFSFEAQLAREPQLCARRMFGERTMHGPQ